jgi:cell division septation protein DedD
MSRLADPDTSENEVVAAPAGADAAPAPQAHACPNCGAPADPGQLMCLECGSRLALDYQRAPTWRLPAAIVGVVVLLAGIGVAIALAAVTNDATRTTAAAPTQPPAQSPPADTPPTASQPTAAPPTATTPAPAAGATPTGTAATAAPAPAPATSGWPPGKSAFTVILASLPTQAGAEEKLQKAKDAGIASAAILHSDDFPTLRPGYWVVFDGQYDAIDQANSQAATDRGKAEFADAYPRFVSKDPNAKP